MKKPRTKARVKNAVSPELHSLLGRLYTASDDFVLAVSGYALYKRDGASRRMLEFFAKALQHAKDVRLLYATLDPKHYREEIES